MGARPEKRSRRPRSKRPRSDGPRSAGPAPDAAEPDPGHAADPPAADASPATPRAVRQFLRARNLRARTDIGQHFLLDQDVLERIVDAAEVGPTDEVLEIGPGLGHLTRRLARAAGRVVAVEIDQGMIAAMRPVLAAHANVEILNRDVLAVDPAAAFPGRPYKIVANLPYYITSPTLRHFLEAAHQPRLMVVMLQKEVAERILATPGHLSVLAISVQVYAAPSLVCTVPAAAFFPPPKVDSAVIRLDLLPAPAVTVDREKLFKVVGAGFAMSRKQLHNALAQRLWMPKDAAPGILREAEIDPMRRAQTLSIPEWEKLTAVLAAHRLV